MERARFATWLGLFFLLTLVIDNTWSLIVSIGGFFGSEWRLISPFNLSYYLQNPIVSPVLIPIQLAPFVAAYISWRIHHRVFEASLRALLRTQQSQPQQPQPRARIGREVLI